MLDYSHLPGANGAAQVFTYVGSNTNASSTNWLVWHKPRGKSMINILLVGRGGAGSVGVIGAASTAAGGGGGGAGAQTRLEMPLHFLPDVLFISLSNVVNIHSYVAIAPNTTANNTLAYAASGGNATAAAGATGGGAGSGGTAATAALMPIGWTYAATVLAGMNGTAGGNTGVGAALTIPVTGSLVTGGTGGAGLGAGGSSGTAGGAFTVAGVFPPHIGGLGTSTATVPPGDGNSGYRPIPNLIYGYGGTGGGSTHGTATGAGLVQSSGGAGAPGCGGGGGGGALTGSTAGRRGEGGPAFCIITVW